MTWSRGAKLGNPGALAVRLAADTPLALEQEVPHTVLTNSVHPAGPQGCRAVLGTLPSFQQSFLASLTSRVLRSLAQVPWTSPGQLNALGGRAPNTIATHADTRTADLLSGSWELISQGFGTPKP